MASDSYEELFASLMPEEVWRGLTPSARGELESLVTSATDRYELSRLTMADERFWEGLREGYPENEGLAWLALATPLKYSLFEYGPGPLALRLLAWDATHLDEVHSRFMGGSVEERLWDQRLSSLSALLGNRAVPPAALRRLVLSVEADWPYREESSLEERQQAFAELLHHVLWDKWTPWEWAPGVLRELEAYFQRRGLLEVAHEYSEEAIREVREEYGAEDDDE